MQQIHQILIPENLRAYGSSNSVYNEIGRALADNGFVTVYDTVHLLVLNIGNNVDFKSYIRFEVYVSEDKFDIVQNILDKTFDLFKNQGVKYIKPDGEIRSE